MNSCYHRPINNNHDVNDLRITRRVLLIISFWKLDKHTLHRHFFNTQSVTTKYLSSRKTSPVNLKGKSEFSHKLCQELTSAPSKQFQLTIKSTPKPTNCILCWNHMGATFTTEIPIRNICTQSMQEWNFSVPEIIYLFNACGQKVQN